MIVFRDNLGGSVEEWWELRTRILSHVPSGLPFLFLIDEEGGLIEQTAGMRDARGNRWPSMPTPRALGRIDKVSETRWVGTRLGERLRHLGLHVDLAPCLDLDTHPENPVIGSRSFGTDPKRVAALGWGFARGLMATKTGACFKHYPGHGGTREDSHRRLPVMEPAGRATHERPFLDCLRRESGEIPWILSAHVDWGDGLPASLSRPVIQRLSRHAPDHLVISDSLDMGAVSLAEGAGRMALMARNDVLLVARDWKAGLEAMEELESHVESDPAVLAAMVRARSRIRPIWDTHHRRKRGPSTLAVGLVAGTDNEAGRRLRRLHRISVRFDGEAGRLPGGTWVWVLPEGLSPYTDLRAWEPPHGRRRFCEEVIWVPEKDAERRVEEILGRLAGEQRPVLVGTLFRGVPGKAARETWGRLIGAPQVRVVAHLLDAVWPGRGEVSGASVGERGGAAAPAAPAILGSPAGSAAPSAPGGSGAPAFALASGPSLEGLTGLAEALDLPARVWRRAGDGLQFPVDS